MSLSRRSAVLWAMVVACLVAGGRASGQTPSKDFVLSYAASHLQAGRHFDLIVTADFATVGNPRRVVYPAAVTVHEPAAQPLHWSFTVPADGRIAARPFRFAFPHPVAAPPNSTRLLFLTVDC